MLLGLQEARRSSMIAETKKSLLLIFIISKVSSLISSLSLLLDEYHLRHFFKQARLSFLAAPRKID